MPKRVANTPRTIRIDDATWKAAGKAASLEGRTVSNWVAILIRREVDSPKWTQVNDAALRRGRK